MHVLITIGDSDHHMDHQQEMIIQNGSGRWMSTPVVIPPEANSPFFVFVSLAILIIISHENDSWKKQLNLPTKDERPQTEVGF